MSRCKEQPIIIQHDCHRMDPIGTPNVSTFLKFEVFRIFQVFQHSVPQPCTFCFSLSVCLSTEGVRVTTGPVETCSLGETSHTIQGTPPLHLTCSNLLTRTASHRAPLKSSAVTGKRAVGLRLKSLLIIQIWQTLGSSVRFKFEPYSR